VFITGNSGFPKSLDISKAIDKAARGVPQGGSDPTSIHHGRYATQLSVGKRGDKDRGQQYGSGSQWLPDGRGWSKDDRVLTSEAQLWDGYGTALKPAYEPIILAMNPVDKTFANNALKYGVAGLNIDGCRVPTNGESPSGSAKRVFASNHYTEDKVYGDNKFTPPEGRFPANFLHDGSEELLELFPQTGKSLGGKSGHIGAYGGGYKEEYYNGEKPGFGDNGSASRFFYCAKASRSERSATNNHPTVKPLALMEYLCKLVKMPEYNIILDPFCGSGSTLLACANLGIRAIGIDSDEQSCEIAANRCATDTVERIRKGEY